MKVFQIISNFQFRSTSNIFEIHIRINNIEFLYITFFKLSHFWKNNTYLLKNTKEGLKRIIYKYIFINTYIVNGISEDSTIKNHCQENEQSFRNGLWYIYEYCDHRACCTKNSSYISWPEISLNYISLMHPG